ncbi:MAG: alginate lyase family protein [Acidobacteria bacterium]|nr:alginate lyase family protein [Acidobacteriota bacterium]
MGMLARALRMDRRELAFRARVASRQAAQRVSVAIRTPKWDSAGIDGLLAGADRRRLGSHFRSRCRLFPVHPTDAARLRAAMLERDPAASDHARQLADPILAGRLDILGYRNVAVGSPINWHRDPVHDRTAPIHFWATVRYLDPAIGDHKVTWELNRHQHWLVLGRAAWLTGDVRYRDAIVTQLRDWLAQNPPLMGINWASMLELAFRSLSWLWALQFCAAFDDTPDDWFAELLVGLDAQLRHVHGNLSYYFSPNTHLLGEALALYVAGRSLPELTQATDWVRTGRRVLIDEIDRQVHADGGHAELSAHYHRYALDFYLLALSIARLTGDTGAEGRFEEVSRRLARYARALADDSGRLPLIGDDDGGQLFPICGRDPADARPSLAWAAALLGDPALAPDGAAPEEVSWLLGRVPDPPTDTPASAPGPLILVFPDSGYVVARTLRRDHVVFDVGRHGFLNGGHAHADALSLVVSVGGRAVLIDPGTSTYTMDAALRDRMRGSGSHNTLLVDGRQQSEPSGPFHWRRTAGAQLARADTHPHGTWMSAAHDGYSPLVHRRGVFLSDDGLLLIVDAVDGDGDVLHTAEVRWHLEPSWEYQRAMRGARLIHSSHAELRVSSTATLHAVKGGEGGGWCAPVYGQLRPTWMLLGTHRAPAPFEIVTALCEGSVPPSLAVRAADSEDGRRLTITIGREGRADVFEIHGHELRHHSRTVAPSVHLHAPAAASPAGRPRG